MRLKSIYIDGLHNAVAKTYELGNIVYLYGRNGAGKTTVLNAIQLALLGYIPGTAKNSREALLKHSSSGRITVRLNLDNDGAPVCIERTYDAKASNLTVIPTGFDIKSTVSEIELPIFNFTEFVGQTANKLKDYFIQNILPTSEGNLDWHKILSDGLNDTATEDKEAMVAYGLQLIENISGTPLEQVTQANTLFKGEQSYNKSELTRLQATVDSLIYYNDYMGPSDLSVINAKLLSLGAIRDALIRYQSAESVASQHHLELKRLIERAEDLGDLSHLDQLKAEYSEQYNQVHAKVLEAEHVLSDLRAEERKLNEVLMGKGICPYTGDTCEQINLDDFQAQYDSNHAKLVAHNNTLTQLNAEQAAIADKLTEATANISIFHNVCDRIKELKTSLSTLPEKPNTEMTLQELDLEIQKYTEDKGKLQANQAYEATIENITRLKYQAELNAAALAAWVKLTDTNGLQTSLTMGPFEELATKMTKYIQNMWGTDTLQAHFNISTKANSFSFGLIRGEKYIPYEQLSAGEQCLYSLALMICITDSNKSPLKLILIDNSLDNLDDIAVENTFTALKNIKDIQFIMAGVKACKNAEDVMVRL